MTDEVQAEEKPAWFIDGEIAIPADRPDWMPQKFRSVAELAKSYSELEKRVGSAPDKYDFSKSRYLDADYEPFIELQDLAREKRVPQEVMDKMMESVDKYFDEFASPPIEDEIKKLGDNADERVKRLDNWAQANLSRDAYESLKTSVKSADAFIALEELRGRMMSETPQVPGPNGQVSDHATVDQLKAELAQNLQKYSTDEAYRKDYSKRLEVAAKNMPGFVDKVGG